MTEKIVGLKTQNQLHEMTLPSFRPMKRTVSKVVKLTPELPELFAISFSFFLPYIIIIKVFTFFVNNKNQPPKYCSRGMTDVGNKKAYHFW